MPMAKWSETNGHPESGLTLIGVLVATLLFSVMLITTTQLLARSEKNVGLSREEFIATNLAREGLELVQYVRDTNWLTTATPGVDWSGQPMPLCSDDADRTITVEPDPAPGSLGVTIGATSPLATQLFFASGRYTHDTAVDTPTPFSREITIVCGERNAPDDEHLTITSRVTWTSRGQRRAVELTTRLYNWRQ